jgi:hypothetical protein
MVRGREVYGTRVEREIRDCNGYKKREKNGITTFFIQFPVEEACAAALRGKDPG